MNEQQGVFADNEIYRRKTRHNDEKTHLNNVCQIVEGKHIQRIFSCFFCFFHTIGIHHSHSNKYFFLSVSV